MPQQPTIQKGGERLVGRPEDAVSALRSVGAVKTRPSNKTALESKKSDVALVESSLVEAVESWFTERAAAGYPPVEVYPARQHPKKYRLVVTRK